jgi:hypothetical protein
VIFYVGLHQPSDAQHFARAFISINRVRERKSAVPIGRATPVSTQNGNWIMDSGAFRELEHFGEYRHAPAQYAADVNRIAALNPDRLRIVVSQDYMCEPAMLAKTGLTIADHQRKTIERYDALKPLVRPYLMPVLQGYSVQSYLEHIEQYGQRLAQNMLVGVGSICKRNGDPVQIKQVLGAIRRARPDIRLHGFGLKTTALGSIMIRNCLYSADSMAWSFAARRQGRNQNSWREALAFVRTIEGNYEMGT